MCVETLITFSFFTHAQKTKQMSWSVTFHDPLKVLCNLVSLEEKVGEDTNERKRKLSQKLSCSVPLELLHETKTTVTTLVIKAQQ